MILGCAGPQLTEAERRLFNAGDPLGFILFARNVVDAEQVRILTADLRASVGRADAPILIDQEGGRVQRLKPPQWRAAPPAACFGTIFAHDRKAGCEAARLNARLIALECLNLGIDVVCAPVGDVPGPDSHDVIGDRAFGRDPTTVIALAGATALGLADMGAIPVIKHLPGHGRAQADSHHALPTVTTARAELLAVDGHVFRMLAHLPWAMTAHVRFTDLDPERAGTISPAVIDFIRREIGFTGFLLSDDLAMNALCGSPDLRATAALAAGCDVALYCAGTLDSSAALLDCAPPLTALAASRLQASRRTVQPSVRPEPQLWRGRLDALMGGLGT